MKKKIIGLLILLTVALGALFSFSSCGNASATNLNGISISNNSSPYIRYDESINASAVTLQPVFYNGSDRTVEAYSFYVEFYDSTSYRLDRRLCTVVSTLVESRASEIKSFEFVYSGSQSNDRVIEGKVASVRYIPVSVTVSGAAANDGERHWGILETIIIILCIGAIVLGIWLTYDGFYLGLDWLRRYPEDIWKPVIGILLIALGVGFPVVYYLFIW